MAPKREIVVAAYEEPLDWVQGLQDPVALYIKSPSRTEYPEAPRLDNVGREAHTYAWHIIQRYESLAEQTLFLQGHPYDHMDHIHNFYVQGLEHEGDFCAVGHWWLVNALGHPLHEWDCPLEEIWQQLFTTPMPRHLTCIRGAQFIVSRDLIRARSLDFWKRVLEISVEHSAGPWALECMWMYIFDPRYHVKL